jgi:hypothetical protein
MKYPPAVEVNNKQAGAALTFCQAENFHEALTQ